MIKKTSSAMIGLAFVAGICLTSCGNSEPQQTRTFNYSGILNIVTPEDVAAPSALSTATYAITFDDIQQRVRVATNELKLGNATSGFETDYAAYSVKTESAEDMTFKATLPKAVLSGNAGDVTDFNFLLTSATVFDSETPVVQGLPAPVNNNLLQFSYKAGNAYDVHTFTTDAYYKGTTNTTFTTQGGAAGTFSSGDIIYRVVLDVAALKADVLIVKGKFAAQAPMLNMLLEDLDIECMHGGYDIKAASVVPQQVTENGPVPTPGFEFKNFIMRVRTSDITSVTASFDVGSRYHGDFTGNCIK